MTPAGIEPATFRFVAQRLNLRATAYVGQTGRRSATRFKEHEMAFRNICHNSSFAKHLNEEAHSGSVHNIMQLLHYLRKGAHLNTLERFHAHTEFAANKPIKRQPNHTPEHDF